MDIKMFQQTKTRKTVRGKSLGKSVNIQIIDFTDKLYEKWNHIIERAYVAGEENIKLTDDEISELFSDFTNIDLTVDELNEILDNPNNTFKAIFKELQLILNEMVIRFLQDKQFEILKTKRMLEETNVLIDGGELEKIVQNLSKYQEMLGVLNGESE